MKTHRLGGSAYRVPLLYLFNRMLLDVGRGSGRVFVPGTFSAEAMGKLRADDWYKARLGEAKDDYLTNRKNGLDSDSPRDPFPEDGSYSWDTPESEEESKIRYTEGPRDRAWMEARDRNYVLRLEREGRLDKEEPRLQAEVPKLYAEVMALRGKEEKEAAGARARLAAQQREQEIAKAQAAEKAKVAAAEQQRLREQEVARARALEAAAVAKKPPAIPVSSLVLDVEALLEQSFPLDKRSKLAPRDKQYVGSLQTFLDHYKKERLGDEEETYLKKERENLERRLQSAAQTTSTHSAGAASGSSGAEEKGESTDALSDKFSEMSSSMEIIPTGQLQYDTEHPLGEGSFGVVYKGRWSATGQEVAVKQLKTQHLSAKDLQELKKEAGIMFVLKHNNIAILHGLCLDPGKVGLVMEYFPKLSLFHLLQSDAELPWHLRLSLALDILQGLAYLHHKGILHRDLKSLNVLIDDRGRGKLTDFGLSRVKTLSSSLGTQSKHAVGTLRWMAPELLDGRPVYSEYSDVYGAAMVVWELTSRKIPYEDMAADAQVTRWVVDKDKRETIPPECVREHREIAAFIDASWQKEPTSRPKAALAVTQLLALKDDRRYQQRAGFFQAAPAAAAASPPSVGFQAPGFQASKRPG